MFRDSYNWFSQPADYMNFDAFVPGCPPKPEAIISAVVKLVEALRSGALVPRCLQGDTTTSGKQVAEIA